MKFSFIKATFNMTNKYLESQTETWSKEQTLNTLIFTPNIIQRNKRWETLNTVTVTYHSAYSYKC